MKCGVQEILLLPITVLGHDPLPREPHCLAHFQTHQPLTTHSDFGFPARPQIHPNPTRKLPSFPRGAGALLALELSLHHLNPFL